MEYMQDIPMAGYSSGDGSYTKGIEDYLSNSQYRIDAHQEMVVKNILDNWVVLS